MNIIFEKFWLFSGFAIPANYDDVGLNCGGLSVQKSNGIYFEIKVCHFIN